MTPCFVCKTGKYFNINTKVNLVNIFNNFIIQLGQKKAKASIEFLQKFRWLVRMFKVCFVIQFCRKRTSSPRRSRRKRWRRSTSYKNFKLKTNSKLNGEWESRTSRSKTLGFIFVDSEEAFEKNILTLCFLTSIAVDTLYSFLHTSMLVLLPVQLFFWVFFRKKIVN